MSVKLEGHLLLSITPFLDTSYVLTAQKSWQPHTQSLGSAERNSCLHWVTVCQKDFCTQRFNQSTQRKPNEAKHYPIQLLVPYSAPRWKVTEDKYVGLVNPFLV